MFRMNFGLISALVMANAIALGVTYPTEPICDPATANLLHLAHLVEAGQVPTVNEVFEAYKSYVSAHKTLDNLRDHPQRGATRQCLISVLQDNYVKIVKDELFKNFPTGSLDHLALTPDLEEAIASAIKDYSAALPTGASGQGNGN